MRTLKTTVLILSMGLIALNTFGTNKISKDRDSLLNVPAPDFTLKDLNGKSISLSAMKGKVIIIDFWATWCEPCKRSFPAAQLTVDYYKQDSSVVFLFIDTKERIKNYPVEIAKFLSEKKYGFTVLLDEQGQDGTQSKVFKGFGFRGIPAKVIVDKLGIVRVRQLGFDPDQSDQKASEALISEIEKVKEYTK